MILVSNGSLKKCLKCCTKLRASIFKEQNKIEKYLMQIELAQVPITKEAMLSVSDFFLLFSLSLHVPYE